ncbi:hypothetical protein LOZ53_005206 [Ophidiomyces ophidiicola]|nr:hypothetical protein LOZ54_004611 [Ophidiomyces ophidiicola]KAI1985058.1 hypothetical protein LOZ53_005206 [Ophidiomyces ophidiicola]
MGLQLSKQVAEELCNNALNVKELDSAIRQSPELLRDLSTGWRKLPIALRSSITGVKSERGVEKKSSVYRYINKLRPGFCPGLQTLLVAWSMRPATIFDGVRPNVSFDSAVNYVNALGALHDCTEIDAVRWRLLAIPLARIRHQHFPGQRMSQHDLDTFAAIIGGTNTENLRVTLKASERYCQLWEEIQGGIVCLPHGCNSVWEKVLPISGEIHTACIGLLVEKGIKEKASLPISNDPELITANTASKIVIDYLTNYLQEGLLLRSVGFPNYRVNIRVQKRKTNRKSRARKHNNTPLESQAHQEYILNEQVLNHESSQGPNLPPISSCFLPTNVLSVGNPPVNHGGFGIQVRLDRFTELPPNMDSRLPENSIESGVGSLRGGNENERIDTVPSRSRIGFVTNDSELPPPGRNELQACAVADSYGVQFNVTTLGQESSSPLGGQPNIVNGFLPIDDSINERNNGPEPISQGISPQLQPVPPVATIATAVENSGTLDSTSSCSNRFDGGVANRNLGSSTQTNSGPIIATPGALTATWSSGNNGAFDAQLSGSSEFLQPDKFPNGHSACCNNWLGLLAQACACVEGPNVMVDATLHTSNASNPSMGVSKEFPHPSIPACGKSSKRPSTTATAPEYKKRRRQPYEILSSTDLEMNPPATLNNDLPERPTRSRTGNVNPTLDLIQLTEGAKCKTSMLAS